MKTQTRLMLVAVAIAASCAIAWRLFHSNTSPTHDEGIVNWPDSPTIVFRKSTVIGEVPVIRSDYRSITMNGRLFLASVTFSEYPEKLRMQCNDEELLTAAYAGVIPSVTLLSDTRRRYGKRGWPCREIVYQDSKGGWHRGVAVIVGNGLCDIGVSSPDQTVIMATQANDFIESLEIK